MTRSKNEKPANALLFESFNVGPLSNQNRRI